MRRSFAPSQAGPASKRPRFNPPQRSTQDVLRLVSGAASSVGISHEKTSQINSDVRENSASSVSSSSSSSSSLGNDLFHCKPKSSGFAPPVASGIKTTANCDDVHVSRKHQSSDLIKTERTYKDLDEGVSEEEDDSLPPKENIAPCFNDNDFSGASSKTCMNKLLPTSEGSEDDVSTQSKENNELCCNAFAEGTALPKAPSVMPKAKFRTSFKLPLKTTHVQDAAPKVNVVSEKSTVVGPKKCYYSVMWCKASKKKHKKWEGDAILVTSGRSVSLLDMDGKEIGRGSGYKTAELNSMQEGHSLNIGGKEIEVMSLLSESEFKSGKCFQATTASDSTLAAPGKASLAGASKPFINPNKGSTVLGNKATALSAGAPTIKIAPRYDPAAPDAHVMPRPSLAHQWQHNKLQLPLVDVVVDPHLSRKLRPHQRDGITFLYQCVMAMRNYEGQGAILADEMGLGKTLQCISLVWTLLKQGIYGGKPVIRRTLVLTPGSLVKNWKAEFKKWLGNERIHVFAVDAENKVQDYTNNPHQPVLIISYEMFVRYHEAISKVKFDLLLCDEGHRLKNTGIKTTTLVSSLTTRRRVVLTGTPVQNDLQELHSLIDFCNPGLLGSSNSFHHVYENPITKSRLPGADEEEKILGETRAAELNHITSQFILRRTQEINNKYLPPKVELVVFCQASPLQNKLYQQLVRSCTIASCLHGNRESGQHLMCLAALKKLCNHPALIHRNAIQCAEVDGRDNDNVELYSGLAPLYPEDFNAAEATVDHSGKMMVLSQLLRAMYHAEPKQRVVLVSNYTQTLDLFQTHCVSSGYSFLRLDGSTPTSSRQRLVDQFNSPYTNTFLFLLSSKAGGVGLNLVGASRLILYDIDWNPANDLQAMARVWRDGQRRKVFIYRLLTTGSIEEKIYQRQVSKQGLSGAVVDAKAASTAHFSTEELKALFRPLQTTLCSTHDLIGCTCCHDDSQSGPAASHVPRPRDCQIGGGRSMMTKQLNVCMSELMQWQHLSGPRLQLDTIDPVMCGQPLEEASFAFWTEVQTTA